MVIDRSTDRTAPKFRRAAPAVRREALVAATLDCLQRFGHEGASVRRISAAAGVSIGLINHHFPSKAGLIAAAYETLSLSLQESVRRVAMTRVGSPRSRLREFFNASFAPELLEPGLFNVWLVFWSMVTHSSEMREVHDRTYHSYRTMLEALLRELVACGASPRLKQRRAGIALSALLDGLWVELCLNPATFKPAQAIEHCEDWTDALCSGAFPRLLAAAGRRRRDG
jgi:AcrR family transcriptional regulator